MGRRTSRIWTVTMVAGLGAVVAACAAKVQAPPEPPATVRRAEEAFRLRDYDRAIELYRTYAELVQRDPYVPRVLYKAALAQYQLGRYEEALATLDDLDARYPDKRWVQVEALRGDAQRALGRPLAAIQSWDRAFALARPADESKLRLRIATVARSLSDGDLDEASQLVQSKAAREILLAVVTQREHPEIPEPLPEFAGIEPTPSAPVEPGQVEAPVEAGEPVAAGLAGPSGRAAEPLASPWLVGVLVPGGEAERGLVRAVELAVGAEHVVARESTSDPLDAQAALRSLASDPQMAAVITPAATQELVAIARERALPLVDLGRGEQAPYVIAAGLTEGESLSVLVDYAVRRARLKRFAVVYPDTAAGRQFFARAQSEILRHGGEIVGGEAYAPDTRGVTAGLLRRWRERDNMQAVLLADHVLTAAAFARFLQREMPDIPLLGVEDWSQLAAMVPDVSGVVFTSGFSPEHAEHPAVEQFRQVVGRLPTFREVSAYEAARWLQEVLTSLPANVARAELWAALQRPYQLEGPSGTFEVANGRFIRRPHVVQFAKGELREVAFATVTAWLESAHHELAGTQN